MSVSESQSIFRWKWCDFCCQYSNFYWSSFTAKKGYEINSLLEWKILNWILDQFSFESVENIEHYLPNLILPYLQIKFIDLKHDGETQIIFKMIDCEFATVKLKDTYPQ
jgi:hypothetical protein